MAINMKTVKAITHNNKSLKNIKDSNGDIIWGSQADYPYRRLKYIIFSGAEYINNPYGTNPWNNRLYTYVCTPTSTNANDLLWGSYQLDTTNLTRFYTPRFYAHTGSGARFCFNSSWTSATSNWTPGHQYNCKTTTPSVTSGSNQTYTVKLTDNTSSTIVINQTLTANWARQSTTLPIGCAYDGSNTTHRNNYFHGYLYYWRCEHATNGTLYINYVACQRKSDGVCGIYDTVNQAFYPMSGTNITSNAAGPVLDEYWDLTA